MTEVRQTARADNVLLANVTLDMEIRVLAPGHLG